MLEIERKFLVQEFPSGLELLREAEVEQGYLSIVPEVRIHKAVEKDTGKTDFRLTVKGDGDLVRTELKTDVSEAFFEESVKLLGKNMIKKTFKAYKFGNWILEVSHVDAGTVNEFFYAEIEFPTEEDAQALEISEYLKTEITSDETYKMKNYWKRTRLQE